MSSTSIIRNVVDKENPTDAFSSDKKSNKGGLGMVNKAKQMDVKLFNETNQCQTPVVKSSQVLVTNSTQKRRALGDVINTTIKTNRQRQLIVGLSPNSKQNDISKIKKLNSMESNSSNESPSKKFCLNENMNLNDDDSLPPVETFHPGPVDTFNDLFEDGKLSSLFMKPNITFITPCFIPPSKYNQYVNGEKLSSLESLNDLESKRYVKNVNKSLKKKLHDNKYGVFEEMPLPLLDDPSLKLLEFF